MKFRLITPILAAIVALGIMVVPASATSTEQQLCAVIADGTKSTYTFTQATCAGPAWPFSAGANSLELIVYARCASTTLLSDPVLIEFNNDATFTYDYRTDDSTGWSSSFQQNALKIGDIPCNPSNAVCCHEVGTIIAEIPFSDSSAFNKVVQSTSALETTNGTMDLAFFAGLWRIATPAAITRIDIGTQSGTQFMSPSHIQLLAK